MNAETQRKKRGENSFLVFSAPLRLARSFLGREEKTRTLHLLVRNYSIEIESEKAAEGIYSMIRRDECNAEATRRNIF